MKRVLAIVGALVLGLLGLFMSLCGGGVALMGFTDRTAASLLVLSLPSLLFGLGLIWRCVRILRRTNRS